MKQWKNILLVGLSAAILFGFSVYMLLSPDAAYSDAERRPLAQLPKISADAFFSGELAQKLDDYTLDQFPLRDGFRSLKALANQYIFHTMDSNGLYVAQGHAAKMEYPMNQGLADRSTEKLQSVYEKYLSHTDCRIFSSVIPDKNFFLAPESGHLSMDYPAFVERFRGNTPFAEYIDIFDTLSLDSYYRTDPHWRQEAILPTAEALAEALDVELAQDFVEHELEQPFYGAYCGQTARNLAPDSIRYLTNAATEASHVVSYAQGYAVDSYVYHMEKADGRDPYEMYLSGSEALLVIENPLAETDRELVIFRDSFGSSLAPLLIPSYAKITLVDLRYLNSDYLGNFLTFDHQDVLFLYSTLTLNHSISM